MNWYQLFKPLTTILILGLPILFWNKENTRYNYLIISALVFCLIGDVLLLKEELFVYGLGSFLLGHLIFVAAFASIQGINKNMGTLLALAVIGGLYFYFIMPSLGSLTVPVLVYVTVITMMNWQAVSLAINNRKGVFMMIGFAALLFSFSDSMIAYHKFVSPLKYSSVLILLTYWTSIFLFAFSTQLLGKNNF